MKILVFFIIIKKGVDKMKYVGSKNRLAKELAPIIQSYITDETKGYLEPFVGGANMIDKIKCENKFGCDIHEELIELLKYVQNLNNVLPQNITEDEYNKVKSKACLVHHFHHFVKRHKV